MILRFKLNGKDTAIEIDPSERKPFSDCDEAVMGELDKDTMYIVYFGIDEDSGKSNDIPCCIDIEGFGGYTPIYNFTIEQ